MSAIDLVLVVFGTLGFFAVGSFTCVIIDRLPRQLDEPNEFNELWDTNPWPHVLGGRSRCSACGTDVRPVDNIPVVSYLMLRGRCRGCGESIPGFHPFVEIAAPVLFLLAVWALGIHPLLIPVLWFIPVALAIAVIDLKTFMVPTRIVWPALGVSVILCVLVAALESEWTWLISALIGVAVLAGPLFAIWFAMPKAMGFGDVRLATFVGFNVGFFATGEYAGAALLTVISLAMASFLGVALGLVAIRARGRKAKVPFGPTMVLAGYVCMILGSRILDPFVL